MKNHSLKIKLYKMNIILALLLAVSTNHSLGEIVHKKAKYQESNSTLGSNSPGSGVAMTDSLMLVDEIISRGGQEYVTLRTKESEGLSVGSTIDIFRKIRGRSLRTATVVVQDSHEKTAIGKVTEKASPELAILEPDYKNVMIGDLGAKRNLSITRIVQVTPSRTISYFDIFSDPNPYPQTFQISPEGKERLRKELAHFQHTRLPTLLIEAHTNAEGNSKTNQVESYQRALTVRQYLINELNFDPKRLVAIGMGEIEPIKAPYLPDHTQKARRIVLKAKAY